MQRRSIIHKALVLTLSVSFLIPAAPLYAQDRSFPIDLLPPLKTGENNDAGLFPQFPSVGTGKKDEGPSGLGKSNKTDNNNNNTQRQNPTAKGTSTMSVAQVPAEFTCNLFDNSVNNEIFKALDELSKQVKTSPACTNDPSAKTIQENGKQIQESVMALTALLGAQSAADVSTGQIDQSITAAISSLGNIGDIINNNEFLNSDCGKQTMSTGRLLLAVNDVIAGLSPYALLAVSMNAALAPALPFVIGAVVGTSGISAIAKMASQDLVDMNNPEQRKAIVQNTCQFVKVTKKVQFLQMAQAGQIEQINNELMKNIDLYSNYKNLSRNLSVSISQRDRYLDAVSKVETQYAKDRQEFISLEGQIKANNDDFLTCILASEMTKWGQDGVSFPVSAFNNLKLIATQSDRTAQAQATALRALHDASINKINQLAQNAATNDRATQACAQASKAWMNGISQALKMTYDTSLAVRSKVEKEMSKSEEYVLFETQSKKIEEERTLVNQVQRAMKELSQDSSIIDRSEMAQRLKSLKAGLFNGQSNLPFAGGYVSLVQQWINHTKRIHDQTMAAVRKDLSALQNASYSITDAGKILYESLNGSPYVKMDPNVSEQSYKTSMTLGNFTLNNLPLGSRENDLACQQLQTTWLDYTAAIDHLRAIQFFCNMIDPVLDSSVDSSIINSCRGNVQLNGKVLKASMVDLAQQKLAQLGYQKNIETVLKRTRDLQCPTSSVTVMKQ